MGGFSDLIAIIVLAVILLLVIEGSHRRRWRSGWYGPTYVYPPFYIFRRQRGLRAGRRPAWGRDWDGLRRRAGNRRMARRAGGLRRAWGRDAHPRPDQGRSPRCMEKHFAAGDYDNAVLKLTKALEDWYGNYYG